ncbi:MAG: L,D-transpeptidase family protein [Magnetococcales bacterium]|nr:L,D-transpeptidase family protein [Magnetococcales bacterium]
MSAAESETITGAPAYDLWWRLLFLTLLITCLAASDARAEREETRWSGAISVPTVPHKSLQPSKTDLLDLDHEDEESEPSWWDTPLWHRLPAQEELIRRGSVNQYMNGRDTLLKLARLHGIGYNEIALINPDIDPWIPPAGASVTVPLRWILPIGLTQKSALRQRSGKRRGYRGRLVINLPEMRLYMTLADGRIATFPVGIGREGSQTPVATTHVRGKREEPTWRVPPSIQLEDPTLPKVVKAGPDNPLGTHAIYLGLPGYLIHGTNKPFGIGRRVSHGCIRMYPRHIVEMFDVVRQGDRVEIVHESVKAGWSGSQLYMSVNPGLPEHEPESESARKRRMEWVVKAAVKRRPRLTVDLDWKLAESMLERPDGYARVIGRPSHR